MTFEEMKAQHCGKNIRKKPKHEEHKMQCSCVKYFRLNMLLFGRWMSSLKLWMII